MHQIEIALPCVPSPDPTPGEGYAVRACLVKLLGDLRKLHSGSRIRVDGDSAVISLPTAFHSSSSLDENAVALNRILDCLCRINVCHRRMHPETVPLYTTRCVTTGPRSGTRATDFVTAITVIARAFRATAWLNTGSLVRTQKRSFAFCLRTKTRRGSSNTTSSSMAPTAGKIRARPRACSRTRIATSKSSRLAQSSSHFRVACHSFSVVPPETALT